MLMLKKLFKISYLYYLSIFFSFIFSILLVSFPVVDLFKNQINQELYTDFENETNKEEQNNEQELDEYITSHNNLISYELISFKNFFQKNNLYKILFLEIDTPPPDLI